MAEGVEDRGGPEPQPDNLPEPARERLPERPPERLPEPRAQEPAAEVGFPREAPPPSTYAPRFRMITGALVGVAVGALAATLVLVTGGGPRPEPSWSTWKPSDRDLKDGAEQIARHVGSRYRLPGGDQLVLVTGGDLKVAGLDRPVLIAL